MGHVVLTAHLLEDNVETAESSLTEREVFERDMRWLNDADLLIAEASGSSYGVGFEVGYVLGRSDVTDQRVLLLYDQARKAARLTPHLWQRASELHDLSIRKRGGPPPLHPHVPHAGARMLNPLIDGLQVLHR